MVSTSVKTPFFWILCVLVLFTLRVIATFEAPSWLWGMDSLADLNAIWWVFLVAFLLPLSGSLMQEIGRLFSRVFERSKLPLFALIVVMGALFAVFRSHNFLLGDSLLYVHALDEGIQIESAGRREAGATFVVSALHWSLRKTILTDSLFPFVVASVAAGIIYIVLAFLVTRLLVKTPVARGLVFASLLATGSLQIFFGHAEYYSLVAASGMLYVYLALRWTKGKGNLLYPAFALAGSMFVHVMNTILLLSFVWLLFTATRLKRYVEAGVAALAVPALLVAVAVVIRYPWESFLMIFSRGKHLLPFSSYDPEFYAYGLLTPAHLVEVANVLLLTAPCLPLLLVAAALSKFVAAGTAEADLDVGGPGHSSSTEAEGGRLGPSKESKTCDRPAARHLAKESKTGGRAATSRRAAEAKGGDSGLSGFLFFAAAGAGLFTFLANPALGMARDWDIFAFPFLVITLAVVAAAAFRLRDPRYVLYLCGAVIVIGGLHLALFVGHNRVKSAYVPRFRRVAMQENLFAPTPRAELWRYLGWEALNMDDLEQAREDLLRSIEDYTTQVKAYKMLAVVEIGDRFNWLTSEQGAARRRALELDTEEKITGEAAHLGLERYYAWTESEAPNKVRAYLGAGIAAIKVSAADSLIVDAFRRAVEADPEDLEARAFWGDMYRTHGLTEKAEEHYDWVLSRRRWHVRAYLGRACLLGMKGEPEMAHIMGLELREHYTWSIEAQQFLLAWRNGELSDPEDFRTFLIAQ